MAVQGLGMKPEAVGGLGDRDEVGGGKQLWIDDPLWHGHRTFLIRRQDNASWFLPMVRMDVTRNVIRSNIPLVR